MNLGWMTMALAEANARAVVLHEFGHALGLVHEHMNPAQPIEWNKEKVRSDMRTSQGWSDEKIDANMFYRYDKKDIFGTDVDETSIMMYPIPPGWTKNGFTVGFNTGLSEVDKTLIRQVYGVRPAFGA
jgi:serralysin